jgi:hypothetical protein
MGVHGLFAITQSNDNGAPLSGTRRAGAARVTLWILDTDHEKVLYGLGRQSLKPFIDYYFFVTPTEIVIPAESPRRSQ